MKEYLKNNCRLLIVCVTLFAIALVGFSYAYGSGTNTIYTRDELSNKINSIPDIKPNVASSDNIVVLGVPYNSTPFFTFDTTYADAFLNIGAFTIYD